jgi:hypothetical protein
MLKNIWRKPVVELSSGARYFGEPYKVPKSNHSSIAKPDSKDAIQHRLLCQFIIKTMYSGPYRLEQADKDDIRWIAFKAGELYGEKDSIPYDVKLSWSNKNQNCFWIIKNRRGRRVGSIEILPLKDTALESLINGAIEEKDITPEDIYDPEECAKVTSLYIENVMLVFYQFQAAFLSCKSCA